jgi:hypothetical protein
MIIKYKYGIIDEIIDMSQFKNLRKVIFEGVNTWGNIVMNNKNLKIVYISY